MQKHVLRVLGLSLLAALGLIAFATAGAQAGKITVLGAEVEVGQKFTSEQEGTAKFLMPTLGIEIRCTGLDVTKGEVIESGAEGKALATVLHLGCKVFTISTGAELSACHLLDGISGTENDITSKALIKIELSTGEKAGKTLITFSADSGQTFLAKIKFTPGLGCVLATPVEIRGSVVFEFITGNLQAGKEVVEPLIESIGNELKYGSAPAYIDSSSKLKLVGANEKCTWGAL